MGSSFLASGWQGAFRNHLDSGWQSGRDGSAIKTCWKEDNGTVRGKKGITSGSNALSSSSPVDSFHLAMKETAAASPFVVGSGNDVEARTVRKFKKMAGRVAANTIVSRSNRIGGGTGCLPQGVTGSTIVKAVKRMRDWAEMRDTRSLGADYISLGVDQTKSAVGGALETIDAAREKQRL
ncbi:nsp-interacting kinase 1 [Corchorus olitorius]|uniref:Nsp-interacting kinase 1 n=1 Tax=Corchorus olitorius TaxID=93759 RepID=A0A1R3JYQ2_9ROSI|nr:nsp-interacting kinase 1 [Corchorus olitorius]